MIRASQVNLATSASVPPQIGGSPDELYELLSVADLKAELRITASDEDARFSDCIREAYERLDGPYGWLNRAILTQTWVGTVDAFDDMIELPLPPLQSVTSITYRDTDGNTQTLATSVYGVRKDGLFGYIYRKKDQSWPDTYNEHASVTITFVAGWGDAADVLTSAYNLRKAIKLLAAHYFRNPTPVFEEPRVVEVPRVVQFGLDHCVGQYRIVNDHA